MVNTAAGNKLNTFWLYKRFFVIIYRRIKYTYTYCLTILSSGSYLVGMTKFSDLYYNRGTKNTNLTYFNHSPC